MDFIPEETKAELNSVEQEFGSKLLKTMAAGTSDAEDRTRFSGCARSAKTGLPRC